MSREPARAGAQPKPSPREAGSALGVALLVLFVVAVGVALATADLALRLRMVRDDNERLALVAMSDAGLAESLAELAADPSFAGYEPSPFGRGTVESSVRGSGNRRFVWVHATVGLRSRTIEATVELPIPPEEGTPRVVAWQPAPPPGSTRE